jgi:hypothetical protein
VFGVAARQQKRRSGPRPVQEVRVVRFGFVAALSLPLGSANLEWSAPQDPQFNWVVALGVGGPVLLALAVSLAWTLWRLLRGALGALAPGRQARPGRSGGAAAAPPGLPHGGRGRLNGAAPVPEGRRRG